MFGLSLISTKKLNHLASDAANWLLPMLSFQNKMRHNLKLLWNLLEKSGC